VGQAETEDQVQAAIHQIVSQLEPLLYLAYKLQLAPLQQQLIRFICTNMAPKALCPPSTVREVMTQRVVLAAAGGSEALGAMAQLLLEASKPNAASEAHARAAASGRTVAGVNSAPSLQGTGGVSPSPAVGIIALIMIFLFSLVVIVAGYLVFMLQSVERAEGVAYGHEAGATCDKEVHSKQQIAKSRYCYTAGCCCAHYQRGLAATAHAACDRPSDSATDISQHSYSS
jgi:hypothetical protein